MKKKFGVTVLVLLGFVVVCGCSLLEEKKDASLPIFANGWKWLTTYTNNAIASDKVTITNGVTNYSVYYFETGSMKFKGYSNGVVAYESFPQSASISESSIKFDNSYMTMQTTNYYGTFDMPYFIDGNYLKIHAGVFSGTNTNGGTVTTNLYDSGNYQYFIKF
jgi:hypothetical protein